MRALGPFPTHTDLEMFCIRWMLPNISAKARAEFFAWQASPCALRALCVPADQEERATIMEGRPSVNGRTGSCALCCDAVNT